MATAEVCGGVWGGEERSEPSCVPPRHGQARGPERCACAGPRGETLSCPGPGRLPGVRASMRAIKGGREGRAASRHKRPPHARPSASCPPHATPTGRRAPAPTSNQLRSLSRRPPQRAKPRPLATRAAMKKPRSEKPCPQSVPLTYRTGSLAAETPERSVVCDGAVCLPTQTHTQHTYTRTQLVYSLSTTDALSSSDVAQNGRDVLASLPGRCQKLGDRPLGAEDRRFLGAGSSSRAGLPYRDPWREQWVVGGLETFVQLAGYTGTLLWIRKDVFKLFLRSLEDYQETQAFQKSPVSFKNSFT